MQKNWHHKLIVTKVSVRSPRDSVLCPLKVFEDPNRTTALRFVSKRIVTRVSYDIHLYLGLMESLQRLYRISKRTKGWFMKEKMFPVVVF